MSEYELVPPASADQWLAYHEIRRSVLFEARGRFGVYDDGHPDESSPGNHPRLLLYRHNPIGTVRIDLAGTVAILRLVAIRRDVQRQGHGRVMLALAERFARENGCRSLESTVATDAVEFYRKCGFEMVGGSDPEAPPPKAPPRMSKACSGVVPGR